MQTELSAEGAPEFGALVISLDFELHWGVRDIPGIMGQYGDALLGARNAVPRLLDTFAEYDVGCTWATVGFLFSGERPHLESHRPSRRPQYRDFLLNPYSERVGKDEAEDPLHFAASLVARIQGVPGQEIGTHTYSHFYCLEPGQDEAAFDADLAAAVRVAAERGITLQSLVPPRNQHNPAYDDVLRKHGIRAYRGNAHGWMHAETSGTLRPALRAARMLDCWLPLSGSRTYDWRHLAPERGLSNVPASFFLRLPDRAPLLASATVQRMCGAMTVAARKKRVLHLWWHPHNFGRHLEAKISHLRRILDTYARLREEHGMVSVGMAEAARIASRL